MKKINTNIKNNRKLIYLSLLDSNNKTLDNGKIKLYNKILHNFSSNDYLGLSKDKDLINESIMWTRKFGSSLSSSRLVSGTLDKIKDIEKRISKHKKKENTLILGSGFQCNATVIPVLIDNTIGKRNKAVLFSDRLNHSSINYGCVVSRQLIKRYNHLDYNHLESLIKKNKHISRKIIISETIFSMDGDKADINILRFLSKKYGCLLYFDEAHATGVFGVHGYGLTPNSEFQESDHEVVVGTFSKAFGSYGSYVSSSDNIIKKIINSCAGLIYSTALPPSCLGSINAAVKKIPNLKKERTELIENSNFLNSQIKKIGLKTSNTCSHIIPIIFSKESECQKISQELRRFGFFVSSILPPTVPKGSSRLRISLTKFIKKKEILDFLNFFNQFKYEKKN